MKKKTKRKLPEKSIKKVAKIDPNLEKIYETTITFTCPVRGLVTQKVKVKRYKTKETKSVDVISNTEDDIVAHVEELDTPTTDSE